MKIALISTPMLRTPPDTYGGLEVIVANLGEALANMGHDVTIFAADGSVVPNCKIFEFGKQKLDPIQTDWKKAEWKALQLYEEYLGDFDIINGHNHVGFEYLAKARNRELKVCHTHHGSMHFQWRVLDFKFNLIAISDWMRRCYEIKNLSSVFVYNGINLEKYPFKKRKGDRLLFVGRIERFKQPHIAIEVAKKLNMGLDIVGGLFTFDSDYLGEIRRMCDGKQIKFYPNASHEEKIQLMRDAKCLLFPSKYQEPFGLVSIEAMACGTPVITTNAGAIDEIVKEGGVVCETYDKILNDGGIFFRTKKDEVEAIVKAFRGIESIKPIDCRRNAERFSKEKMAEEYFKLYKQILVGNEW